MKDKTMLSRILGLGNEVEKQASAEVASLQAEFDAYKATAEELLAGTESELKVTVEKLAEAAAAVAELEAKIEALQADARATAEAAEAKRLADRKEKIVAAVGTERADALMTATEGLGDEAFNAVLSALTLSVDAEANADMFKEVGASADADATKIVEESAEMQIIKKRYQTK